MHRWILRLGRTTVTRLSTRAAAVSFHCSKPSDLVGEGHRAGISRGAAVTVEAWTPYCVSDNVPLPLVMKSSADMDNDPFTSSSFI